MTVIRITARQRQVVFLIAQGFTAAEIGEKLGIGASTAQAHADAIRARLDVPSRRMIPAAYWRVTGENPWPSDPLHSLDYIALSDADIAAA